jgi:SAM-dependent methyltransferase
VSPPSQPADSEGSHLNRRRAESFGARADQYDRTRPSYPDALFDELAALGAVNALDVGCGTGKAAVALTRRGLRVLGIEIDERMAGVARAHGVPVEVAPFEEWDDAGRRFDIVVSAQAWHWVDPVRGAQKAARVLRPAGHVALFWNIGGFTDQVRRRMDEVYAAIAPRLQHTTQGGAANRGWKFDPYRAPLEAAGLVHQRTASYPWQQVYSRDEWLELLATHSDHTTLPPDVFDRLRERVGAVIDEAGGVITIEYATQLLLASR